MSISPSSSADSPLYRLMYMSTSRNFMSEGELEQLLEGARQRNAADGITGMLIYVEGHFLQIIEGSKESVERLSKRIAADPRHSGIIHLMAGPIDRRAFADWSMGFQRLSEQDGQRVLGAVDLARNSLRESLPEDLPQELLVFMESFYRSSLGAFGQADQSVA